MFATKRLTNEILLELLQATGREQVELHQYAREVREKYYGNELFLRSVIELSNVCSCNCLYCGMRRDNHILDRKRLFFDDVKEVIDEIHRLGIRTLMLQSGEDKAYPLDELCRIIAYARDKGLENIILCMGVLDRETYLRLFEAGANKYIMKFETSNPHLYQKIKQNDRLEQRLENIRLLQRIGYKVGSGNICGLPGQTPVDLINDIRCLQELQVDMASVSPFISHQESPFRNDPNASLATTLNLIAIMRIVLQDVLIPSVSALEIIAKGGQLGALNAGANVVTINMTPQVFRDCYKIYDENRHIVSLSFAEQIANAAGMNNSCAQNELKR